jgi:hypothetical protein
MAGELPALSGGDGVAVVVNNAAANKLDVYLERDVRYRATVDTATGQTTGTLEVTLKNDAPSEGLPSIVLDNAVGLPPGTNRALVTIYTALPVQSTSLDGQPVSFETGREQGWITSLVPVTLPPGGSQTITLEVTGTLDLHAGYRLSTRPQPLVAPEHHALHVTSTDGDRLVDVDRVATEPQLIVRNG